MCVFVFARRLYIASDACTSPRTPRTPVQTLGFCTSPRTLVHRLGFCTSPRTPVQTLGFLYKPSDSSTPSESCTNPWSFVPLGCDSNTGVELVYMVTLLLVTELFVVEVEMVKLFVFMVRRILLLRS